MIRFLLQPLCVLLFISAAMVVFILKGLKLGLLVPHIPGPIPSANDWSQMRWIVVGPSTDSELELAFVKLRESMLEYPWDDVISDEFFSTAVAGDETNLWSLDVFPALFLELFHGQLLPISLMELERRSNVCGWITQKVNEVCKSIYDQYLSSPQSDGKDRDETAISKEIEQMLRKTLVSLTPGVLLFVREFLGFLHNFLVARFPPDINFEKDVSIASLWLGESFEAFLKEKTRNDLIGLQDAMQRYGAC